MLVINNFTDQFGFGSAEIQTTTLINLVKNQLLYFKSKFSYMKTKVFCFSELLKLFRTVMLIFFTPINVWFFIIIFSVDINIYM
jgi:hypothetical protein